ncbi:MAG: FKBP-type peptidyl-prolyl cis-trans isomerase [Dinghuibacter sp.]|nr:FKBP-type peptidyl-prolyl cis-trans isomerase [Dinghuibacter sp.]
MFNKVFVHTITLLSLLFICSHRLPAQGQNIIETVQHDIKPADRVTGFYTELTIPPGASPENIKVTAGNFKQGSMGFTGGAHEPFKVYFLVTGNTDTATGKQQPELLAKGENVQQLTPAQNMYTAEWAYQWQPGNTYKFYVTLLADSAKQTTDYTGYFFIPETQQWKLLASFRTPGYNRQLNEMTSTFEEKAGAEPHTRRRSVFANTWVQMIQKGWKCLGPGEIPDSMKRPGAKPPIDLYANADSATQAKQDAAGIAAYCKRTGMNCQYKDGIYYYVIKPGNRPMAKLTDTLVVYYRGTLLDGTEFDKTGEEPATFPLNRLIKGWQTGLQQIGEGGRIQLMLPSAKAYGLRHLGIILPNSVLIFDVEIERIKQ